MKKIISIAITMVMLFVMTANASEVTDMAREDIPIDTTSAEMLQTLKIMSGTEKGLELDRNITRAEAVVLIGRLTNKKWGGPRGIGLGPDGAAYKEPFGDMRHSHWAYWYVFDANSAGIVSGTPEGLFEPDRTVTGKEFAKMLLAAMGYDASIENALDLGIKSDLITDNFTKYVVYNNCILYRSDAARMCAGALTAQTSDGAILYKKMINDGRFKEEDFEGILHTSCTDAMTFADRLNAQMPQDQNYMFSPLSIKMALAMAANGARDETRDEILNAMGAASDISIFNQASKEMIEKYSKTDLLRLDIANAVWINESKTSQNFRESYQSKIAEFYKGTAEKVDDVSAVKTINDWVREKTNEKISSIINHNEFWAMLVNAVYFKAAWMDEFNESATKEDIFTDGSGHETNVDFMNRRGWMNYCDFNGVKAVELPYQNRRDNFDESGTYIGTDRYGDLNISMFVMLCDEAVDCEAVLKENKAAGKFGSAYIALSLPKFKIEYEAGLNELLKNLGINRAFTSQAQFEDMFTEGNMWITDAVHKTYISVDEKGTEAAAVTSIEMAGAALPPEPIQFKADQPFTFIIRDNTNGEVLFMGRYAYVEAE